MQMDWYYGMQTVIWALLLLALLILAGYIVWQNRNDLLILVFGLVPLSMCILGSILSALHPTNYSLGAIARSLLVLHSYVGNMMFYGLMATMALFFLPANRQIRWLALILYGLLIGLGHNYLNDVVNERIYYLWAILPLLMVFFGWWVEQSRTQNLKLASS